MVKDGDFDFATENDTNLAQIFIEKGDVAQAGYYTFWAKEHRTGQRPGLSSRVYETLSKYYALTGNGKLSMAYIDSLLVEKKREEQQFSALQMLRMEQKIKLTEQKLKEEQLNAEKIKKERYRSSLILSILAVLFVSGVLTRYIILFRKKKAAYRELVLKSQKWANVTFQTGMTDANSGQEDGNELTGQEDDIESTGQEKQIGNPDEADFLIMKEIEKMMQGDKVYRDSALTSDSLARKLGAKKYHVSRAIRCCTTKSFNTFINEYRIKEAVQLYSDKNASRLLVDSVAFDVGFTDRHSFYRVFKKMTGLSPTEFRKNMYN
jgi:AraC-like DNA-binding protein